MELNLTTPGLLFSAISLLLLAYTNRFLSIAKLIRALHTNYLETNDKDAKAQIKNLQKRIRLIKNMQILGIASLFLSVFCMVALFAGWILLGKILFGLSLILLLISCQAKFSWFYLLNLVRVGMSCFATPELSPARWRR